MISNKIGVRNLVEICAQKGIRQVIISPGSRNAPLVISFSEHGSFDCLSIPDERVAAFFALGIAQQTRKPVILTCTSGTATLNYAPAIAEAFYQKIPLLIITADRPIEWIHQGEGQSIQQRNVFANYIKKSYELPQEIEDKDEIWSTNRIICEAIDKSREYPAGPVHLNIPFREPLYDKAAYETVALPKIIRSASIERHLTKETLKHLAEKWGSATKKMILCGLMPPSKTLNQNLKKLAKDSTVIILTENTANLAHKKYIHNFDSVLSTITVEDIAAFKPDLLITIGGAFISKRIKLWLRKNQANAHWHIEEHTYYIDTFQSLSQAINIEPSSFFQQFLPVVSKARSTYQKIWQTRAMAVEKAQLQYLKSCSWSDLIANQLVFEALPKNTNLHLANSTPVRYAQLYKTRKDIIYNSNRGVAGIDGSTSTAAGAAFIHGKPTTIITGDISFFYDSNAFWQHHLAEDLRVIMINNGGGNIFRFIKGPDSTKQLTQYFEAHQERSAEYIAKTFDLNYFVAESKSTLKKVLKPFYKKQKNKRPAILEIKTPRMESAKIWRDYYEALNIRINGSKLER